MFWYKFLHTRAVSQAVSATTSQAQQGPVNVPKSMNANPQLKINRGFCLAH